MARKSGHVYRGGRIVKRSSFWFNLIPGITAVAGGNGVVLIASLSAAALALRPFTIVRTRIHLGIRSDQTSAPEDQLIAYGHVVVQDTAVAIGVTAVPTPITDMQSDWHFYELLYGRFAFVTGVGFDSVGLAYQTPGDSKAMRKVDFGQDLAVVAETTDVSDGVQIYDGGRVLIKLH